MSLFQHYPGRPGTIDASARSLETAGTAIADVGHDAADASLPVEQNVLGVLLRPAQIAIQPVSRSSQTLSEASGFASSVLRLWSAQVTTYDATVDRLNQQYREAAPADQETLKPTLTTQQQSALQALDDIGDTLAGMLDRGPNDTDWSTLATYGAVPVAFMSQVPGGRPGEEGGPDFVVGPPTRPDIEWDEGFEYGTASPNLGDYIAKAKWLAKMEGGRALRSDLDDATTMYRHYWDNNGDDIEFDYEEGYAEDEGIRRQIDEEIRRAQQGAEDLVGAGHRDFSMTGDAHPTGQHYPTTENWQKTIGGHQTWSSADVTVDGDTITMKVTVHGEDYYNFNPSQQDIATGAPDNENGRFTELGWAKPFHSHGEVTRTVTWTRGELDGSEYTNDGDGPQRNPGREDRTDERGSGDDDRPTVPDNNRDTGPARG